MKNYTITHLHSDLSNPVFIDSATKFEMYVDKAVELGMKAIAFTEHGGIYEWVNKKKYCEKLGIKYIHGEEFYITATLEEKIKDNYHICLYARNWEGVKELNRLSSIAYNKNDNHFYYVPRISFDELSKTSKNIIITTACTGGILASDNVLNIKFLDFIKKNKDRCFLEIQHHNVQMQKDYNKMLLHVAKEYDLQLIAGTDTHSLNKDYADARIVLQQSKNIHFSNEEAWDLTFKSYDELINAYKIQNALPMNEVEKAIRNTNKLADMVEEFEFDRSNKYPRLYKNSKTLFQEKILEGVHKRHFDKLSKDEYEKRIKQIQNEYDVYESTDTIDYMLFMKTVIDFAHANGMWQGYGRGSVNGSLIAYLLGITDMDSVKFNLNFFRFMNPQRVSLADIDTDWSNVDRDRIKEFLFTIKGIQCAEIITFNTSAMKNAIRDVARALNINHSIADEIAKNIENNEEDYRAEYPELFKYVDLLNGVIVSVGTHPSGILTSPIDVQENIGTCMIKDCDHPVTALYMKELDYQNYVKLDILGLDNIDIINRTCALANIERITPDNLDLTDTKVWGSIREDTTCIFQWESDSAQSYIRELFSEETLAKIKKVNPNISMLNLFSFGNGAIRPSGASFRNEASKGVFYNNGFEPLNDALRDTLCYLCYQEQIMKFLVVFCGYSDAESDTVRRGIAKKVGTEKFIPEIKRRFIETMKDKYGVDISKSEKIIEPFLKVILDSSDYGFSKNHSDPYSIIGYGCGWLRYYYPLEFITSALNVCKDKIEKVGRITQYASKIKIKIKPIQFRYSRAEYFCDKNANVIYQGIESIKYMNAIIAEELYSLKDNKYDEFTSLLVDITEKTSCNSKQTKILIALGYFKEFGKNGKLMEIYSKFENRYKIMHKDKTKIARIQEIKEFEKGVFDYSLNIKEQIKCDITFMGYTKEVLPNVDKEYCLVSAISCKYKNPIITLYHIKDGYIENIKVKKDNYEQNKFELFDMIKVTERKMEWKWLRVGNGFKKSTEKEPILHLWNNVK